MSHPIIGEVTTTGTGDGTHSLNGLESGDVKSAGSSLITPVTSKEVAKQIEAATKPVTKRIERLNEETPTGLSET